MIKSSVLENRNKKIEWGISAGTHDASITVMRDTEIVFASHSERYSRIKNDKDKLG